VLLPSLAAAPALQASPPGASAVSRPSGNARAEFERARELRASSLVSQAELEQKKAQHELARVEAERARLVIDRSVVRAPFDGVVVDRMVRIGQKTPWGQVLIF
jgi:multidrug resistance efflux pump